MTSPHFLHLIAFLIILGIIILPLVQSGFFFFSTAVCTEAQERNSALLQNGVLLHISLCLLAPGLMETTSGHFNSQHKLSTLTWFETFLPTA